MDTTQNNETFNVSSDSSDVPPISPVHIDFDDLKNDILEMENSNPAVFDELLSNFNCIGADVSADVVVNAKDDNQSSNINANETDGEASNGAVSTTSTNATVDTANSRGGGIKLVPIESLMQSNVEKSTSTSDSSSSRRRRHRHRQRRSSDSKANKKNTAKCHGSDSLESVEELSSETSTNDEDNDNDDDYADDDNDRPLSRTRHKRTDKHKEDLKNRFKQLREKAQAKRPNYADRSNSEESDESNSNDSDSDGDGDGNNQNNSSSEENKKSTKKSRTSNAKSSKKPPAKPRNVYGATVRLAKLPTDMNSLLYKYDLIEIRDRNQKILASRPKTHRIEVHSQTYHQILNLNSQLKQSPFLHLRQG